MIGRILIVFVGTVLLGGCFNVNTSQAPMATTYPYSEQRKMQAAHHWQVLAAYEARQILRDPSLEGRAFFMLDGGQDMPFSEGFGSLLTSQLVSNGAIVRTDPINAAQIDYRVQVVEHEDRDFVRPPRGALTTLAAGIAVATIPINHWSEPALALIPAAAAVDAFSGSWASVSNEEVIITTQVIDNNRILYSSSNIYYINPGDDEHYRSVLSEMKTIPVTNRW